MTPSLPSSVKMKTDFPLLEAIHKLEEKISEAVQAQDTPGLAVAVFSRDEDYYRDSFGVTRQDFLKPITSSTLFQLASVSKPVSATTFALLQQKGMCSFQDHPNRYLPNLFKGTAYDNLTIQNMFSHTSGISYEGFEELIESYTPREHILKVLDQTPVTNRPGQKFDYNNVIYGLVGDIMTSTTGKPIEAVLKEYLFAPLGMEHSSSGFVPLIEASDRAYPYMEGLDGNLVAAPHYSHSYYTFPTAGGINSCVNDMVSFIQLYLGKYPQLITKEALAPLLIPTVNAAQALPYIGDPCGLIKDVSYGLGWFLTHLAQERLVYHTGFLNGFRNFVAFLPDQDIGIVVLSNTERKIASSLGLEFFFHYLKLGG